MRKVTTAFALLLLITSAAQATIVAEGGYSPTDQSWSSAWATYVGYSGEDGTITATNETIQSKLLFLGYDAGVEGTLNLDGTAWTVVEGSSTLFGTRIGGSGSGVLNLTNNSTMNCNAGRIGTNSGSVGTATISGSTWNITTRETQGDGGQLQIGEGGTGTLAINQGGIVKNVEGTIGNTTSGTGTVTVTGSSRWENSGELRVGYLGEGSLLIEEASVVTSSDGLIGRTSAGNGDVTVTGEGSQWLIQESLMVGMYGNGTLEISDNGLVGVGSTLTIDNNNTDECFLNMSTGGMLALYDSDNIMSGSLSDFLTNGVLGDSEALMFWDDDESGWMPMSTASPSDYTLQHITEGFGEGFTVLTVGGEPVPEPSTVVLLLSMIAGWLYFRRR